MQVLQGVPTGWWRDYRALGRRVGESAMAKPWVAKPWGSCSTVREHPRRRQWWWSDTERRIDNELEERGTLWAKETHEQRGAIASISWSNAAIPAAAS